MDRFTDIFTNEFWHDTFVIVSRWLITTIPTIILLFILFVIARKGISYLIKRLKIVILKRDKYQTEEHRLESEKRLNTLMDILNQAGLVILWIIFVMILLKEFGLDIGPLIASAGVIGLAIGFGAQELVRDIISGFFMLLENQIRNGDVAIINGTGGLVEKIELRTITLRDFAGTVHIFQNGKINTMANMTKEWSAIVFNIGVAYKEDMNKVIQVIRDTGEKLKKDAEFGPKIIEDIEVFGVDDFADSAIVIKARIKTKPIEQWSVGREYRKRLKYAFDENHIEIPFPHVSVYWGEEIKTLKMKMDDQ